MTDVLIRGKAGHTDRQREEDIKDIGRRQPFTSQGKKSGAKPSLTSLRNNQHY